MSINFSAAIAQARAIGSQTVQNMLSSNIPEPVKKPLANLIKLSNQAAELSMRANDTAGGLGLKFCECIDDLLAHSKTLNLSTAMVPVGFGLFLLGQRLETPQPVADQPIEATTPTKKYLPTLLKITGIALLAFSVVSSIYSIRSLEFSFLRHSNDVTNLLEGLAQHSAELLTLPA